MVSKAAEARHEAWFKLGPGRRVEQQSICRWQEAWDGTSTPDTHPPTDPADPSLTQRSSVSLSTRGSPLSRRVSGLLQCEPRAQPTPRWASLKFGLQIYTGPRKQTACGSALSARTWTRHPLLPWSSRRKRNLKPNRDFEREFLAQSVVLLSDALLRRTSHRATALDHFLLGIEDKMGTDGARSDSRSREAALAPCHFRINLPLCMRDETGEGVCAADRKKRALQN